MVKLVIDAQQPHPPSLRTSQCEGWWGNLFQAVRSVSHGPLCWCCWP